MTPMPVSGLSLKLQRISRDVKALDLAARMGVSNSTVSRIESSRIVDADTARRYTEALATFATVVDHAEPASAA